jgi:hypothetical protein
MDNPRIWSLWDIMNLFDVYALSHILHKVTQSQIGFSLPKMRGEGHHPVDAVFKARAESAMAEAQNLFTIVKLPDCLQAVRSAKFQWERPLLDNSAATEIMYRLGLDIIEAMRNRQFLRVEDDRLDLIMHMRGEVPYAGALKVFGDAVRDKFNSSVDDIEQAGNCLAAECNTAAVFHLMRIAEVGLRALAKDRDASFKNKPIDQQEWGTILIFLDACLRQLREDSASNWPDPQVKDVQLRFSGQVVGELRGFNEAWRRHISHAREDGIYDRDYAISIFKHVVRFMQQLAVKISEDSITPKYWTANEIKLGI